MGFLFATLDHLLQGEEHYYETVAESLQLSAISYQLAPAAAQRPTPAAQAVTPDMLRHVAAAMALVKAFRTHGHLAAKIDPLGTEPLGDPALDPGPLGLTPEIMALIPTPVLRTYVPGATLAESYPHLEATYCGTLGYQIEHISSHEQRVWLREKVESGEFRTPLTPEEKWQLSPAHPDRGAGEVPSQGFLGQKRFSIEGVDMLVPMLDLTLELGAAAGAREVVIGMAHRGRSTCSRTRSAAVQLDLRRVRGRALRRGQPAHARGQHRRREVSPRRRRRVPAAEREVHRRDTHQSVYCSHIYSLGYIYSAGITETSNNNHNLPQQRNLHRRQGTGKPDHHRRPH